MKEKMLLPERLIPDGAEGEKVKGDLRENRLQTFKHREGSPHV